MTTTTNLIKLLREAANTLEDQAKQIEHWKEARKNATDAGEFMKSELMKIQQRNSLVIKKHMNLNYE